MTSDRKITMPRSYKKTVGGRSYQNYDPNIIKNAVDAVRYKKMSNNDEESRLVVGLLKCSEWGFPMKYRDIQLVVKLYLDRLGKSSNKHNKFNNNLPGKDWVELILKRILR